MARSSARTLGRSSFVLAWSVAAVRCASLAGLTGGSDVSSSDGGGDASRMDGTTTHDASRHDDAGRHDTGADAARRDAGMDAKSSSADGSADSGDGGCTMCGGHCVDTTSSASNCGGCGVTCRQCTNSYCLNYLDEGDPGQAMPALTFLSPLVYWAGAADGGDDSVTGDILDASAAQPERVVEYFHAAPVALAADQHSVYVGGVGFLGALSPPAAAPLNEAGLEQFDASATLFDASVKLANAVAVDDTNVYWTDSSNDTVLRMPKAGGPVTTLATIQYSLSGLAVDSAYVYWLSASALYRTPITATASLAPTTLASVTVTGTGPTALVVKDGVVYYPDTQNGAIVSILATGGTPVTFAGEQPNATAVATDGASLYWTTNTPSGCAVVKQPLSGGSPLTIARFEEPGIVLPGGLTLAPGGDAGAAGVFVSAMIAGSGVLLEITPPPAAP